MSFGINLLVKERSIRVTCDGCGRPMDVSATSAGCLGRCPHCGGDVRVPARETTVSDRTATSEVPGLVAAVVQVVALGRCVSHDLGGGRTASVELATGKRRTQMVHLTALEGGSWVAWSIVGSVMEGRQATEALRAAERCPALNLCVNADDVLLVRKLVPDGALRGPQALLADLQEVGSLADDLEAQFFGWDRM